MNSIEKLELYKEWRKHTKEERSSLLCDFILKEFSTEDVTSNLRKNLIKNTSIFAKFAEKSATN